MPASSFSVDHFDISFIRKMSLEWEIIGHRELYKDKEYI